MSENESGGYVAEGLATKVDKYLRREDTLLAKGIKAVCELKGAEYRGSEFKRKAEIVIATPLAAIGIPVSSILGVMAKMEDGGEMYFHQERLGKNEETVLVRKVRTMRAGSADPELVKEMTAKYEPGADPRNTKLGQKIRDYELDELPQLLQVLTGELSLIGIRAAAEYAVENIEENRPMTAKEWQKAYNEGGPGLFSLNSAVSNTRKDDLKRHHYDMLYARKASLGLDLFILYRTSVRMLRKLEEKTKAKMKQVGVK